MPIVPVWDAPAVRKPGWERAYADVIHDHFRRSFAWGVSDCLAVPADLSLAMCGRDVLPLAMRRYRSATGARRLLGKLGFATVEEALRRVFPEIAKTRARRGDCGVLEQPGEGMAGLVTMIVLGDGSAIGKGEAGMVRVSLDRLKATFAIGDF